MVHRLPLSCALHGLWADFTSTFTDENTFHLFTVIFFFNFLGTSTLKPDKLSPANLHSETELKSAPPGNRPTGKMDPGLPVLPQCTQGLVKFSMAIYIIKPGPWAPRLLPYIGTDFPRI